MKSLSPGMNRLLALAILVFVILIVVFYLVLPTWNYYAGQVKEVSLLKRELNQFEFLLANEVRIDEELASIQEQNTGEDLFLAGNKPAIASANLREFVNEAVKLSDGILVRSQEYEAEEIPGTTPVGLQLQLSGDVSNLVELLHTLESAKPVIFIDELNVRSSSSRVISARRKRNDNAQAESARRNLDIHLDIVGYLAGGEVDGS